MLRRTALVSALLASLAALPTSAAAAPLRCSSVAHAPDEVTSGAMLCVAVIDDGGNPSQRRLEIRTSHDHGRTWALKAGRGLPAIGTVTASSPTGGPVYSSLGTAPTNAFYSAGYATDGAMYVNTYKGTGLMRSLDDGDTWTVAAPLAAVADPAQAVLRPYVDRRLARAQDGGPVQYPIALGALSNAQLTVDGDIVKPLSSERLDPPKETFATGTPEAFEEEFFFPDDLTDTGYAVGFSFGTGPDPWAGINKSRTALYRCDLDVTCTTLLHAWAPGHRAQVGLPFDVARSRRAYAAVVDLSKVSLASTTVGYRYELSADAGRTWKPWAAVEALRTPARKRGYDAAFGVLLDPRVPSRVLLVGGDYCTTQKQCDALTRQPVVRRGYWESRDAGSTFRYVAGSGTEPWRDRLQSLQLLPSGRLVALTGTQSSGTWYSKTTNELWCSADVGRHWTRGRC